MKYMCVARFRHLRRQAEKKWMSATCLDMFNIDRGVPLCSIAWCGTETYSSRRSAISEADDTIGLCLHEWWETKEPEAAQEAGGNMPVLVVKDKRTKTLAASFVPEKVVIHVQ